MQSELFWRGLGYHEPIDPVLGTPTSGRLAFAEIGRDRCGLGPFPTWSLFKRYGLRERDFKVTMESVGERSGDGAIGPYFQLLLDAEDEAARVSLAQKLIRAGTCPPLPCSDPIFGRYSARLASSTRRWSSPS